MVVGSGKSTVNKSLTTGRFSEQKLKRKKKQFTYGVNRLPVSVSDYPVDFSSKGSVCDVSDTLQQGSKELTRPSRSSFNNEDESSPRYDLSEVSDEVDDDDEIDGADDDEIIDIVGDHSHIMQMNSVQRNHEQQRFF